MSFPTPPAPRILYHEDGTRALMSLTVGDSRAPYIMDNEALAALNSDTGEGLAIDRDWWDFARDGNEYYSKNWISLVFPHAMDLSGIALSALAHYGYNTSFGMLSHPVPCLMDVEVQVSPDTTHGLDGAWETVFTKTETDTHLDRIQSFFNTGNSQGDAVIEPPTEPDGTQLVRGAPAINGAIASNVVNTYTAGSTYRLHELSGPSGRGIASFTRTGVKGVRLYFPRRTSDAQADYFWSLLTHLHVYGRPSASVSDDRLIFRNEAGTGEVSFSFGDTPAGETETRAFRVENTSDSDTAVGVSISLDDTEWLQMSDPEALALSLDGGATWSTRLQLGDLTPGSTSPRLLLRLNPTLNAVGLRSALVRAMTRRWS